MKPDNLPPNQALLCRLMVHNRHDNTEAGLPRSSQLNMSRPRPKPAGLLATNSRLKRVAHALLRAASALVPTPVPFRKQAAK
jgi:hypothetical protein